jgi:hypothetical protein
MRKTKFLPLIVVLAFFQASCDDFFDLFSGDGLAYLNEGEFYAQNLKTNKYYKVKAELLAGGPNCAVWVENGSGVNRAQAKAMADEYENNIRPMIVGAFGKKNFYASTANGREVNANSQDAKPFNDILDYANWWADGTDKKLTILLLDIKDGYDKVKNPSFVAGYFVPINFWPQGKIPGYDVYANGRDMIYIDTNPGFRDDNVKQTYSTLAHELQHLINFVTNFFLPAEGSLMDTWIDEGLSAWAEYLYEGGNLVDKCDWFVEDKAGTIAKGNNFFVWGNHEDVTLSILDEYSTVYLFFRWLYLQADENLQKDIFYKIITSPKFNHAAVTDVAKEINPEWASWEKLLGAWLAANYNPKNTNYGYKGDDYLKEKIKVKTVTGTSISLYPGEGVYSSILNNSFTPTGQWGNNIRYSGLSSANTSTAGVSGDSKPYTGNILLTFNARSDYVYDEKYPATGMEQGRLTGLSSTLPRSVTGETETVEFKGPYVLDARDVLGRNRDKNLFTLPELSGR